MGARIIAAAMVLVASSVSLAFAAEGGGHDKIMDFVWRLMNFAVLIGALIFLLRKPISQGLSGRAQTIEQELKELEAKREEARQAYALMEKRLQEAEQEREAILAEFRAQGEREKEKIIQNAKTLAERIKSQAQFTIDQETKQAKAELRREVAELSANLAEDLLKQNINAEDQSRLVNEYLDKVGQEVQ